MAGARDPERLLEGLNEAQSEAVHITTGPLAIIAIIFAVITFG